MKLLIRINNWLYQFGYKFLGLFGLLFLGLLTLSTLLVNFYAEDMDSQVSEAHVNVLFLRLFGVLCIAALMLLIRRCCMHKLPCGKCLLLFLASCWIIGWGIYLVRVGKTIPQADSACVYSIGEAFAQHNFQMIHPTDSYLSYYPQQIGLSAFYGVVMWLWNLFPFSTPAYQILKCINVLCAWLILYSQYRTTHLLFGKDQADILYLLLAMFHAPLIMYTSFIYGEIPAFALFSAGVWLLLEAVLSHIRPAVLLPVSAAALILSVALRKNTLVLIIAVCIALFWEWLRTHRHGLIIYGLCLMLGAMSILPGIQSFYEHRAGNTLSSGVPAIAYLAMGMQEASRGNGWYNGFNFYTYQDTGMDTQATAVISRQAISDRLETFREDPGYALSFYRDKFLSQWTDGSYFCRQATQVSLGERTGLLAAIYDGSLSDAFMHFCNLWQTLIYLCALLCLLPTIRRQNQQTSFLFHIGLIGVLGGFLFHMIWEANSRYIFPYALLLLPYAAGGLCAACDMFCHRFRAVAGDMPNS